jgi:hypothetical protein
MTLRIPLALALAFAVVPARAETFTSLLSEDGRTLAYTPCAADEASECVSHDLNCRGDDGFGDGLAMTLLGASSESGPDTRKLAKALIDRDWGEARVDFTVGSKTVSLTAHAVTVSLDEMSGDWDLSLHFQDDGVFFDALTDASAADVAAHIEGYAVPLASTPADGANLMKFKKACDR